MLLHKIVTFFLLTSYIDLSYGNQYTDGVILHAEVEYQRNPWMTVTVNKFVNSKGSYNFKFHWNVIKTIADAEVTLYKWPLVPHLQSNGIYLNTTIFDKACDAIREDFFGIFNKNQELCVPGKNIIQKGHYYFGNNLDNAELILETGTGTMVYVLHLDHSGAPLLRMRFFVDSNLLTIKKKYQIKSKRV